MEIQIGNSNEKIIIHRLVLEINLTYYEQVDYKEINRQVELLKESIIQQIEFSLKESLPTGPIQAHKVLINKIEVEASGNASNSFGRELASALADKLQAINGKVKGAIASRRQGNETVYRAANILVESIQRKEFEKPGLERDNQEILDAALIELEKKTQAEEANPGRTEQENAEAHNDPLVERIKSAASNSIIEDKEEAEVRNKSGHNKQLGKHGNKQVGPLLENELIIIGEEEGSLGRPSPSSAAFKEELLYFFVHGRNRWQTFRAIFNFENKAFVEQVRLLLVADSQFFLPVFVRNTNAFKRFVNLSPRAIVEAYFEALLLPLLRELTNAPLLLAQIVSASAPVQQQVLKLTHENKQLINAPAKQPKVLLLLKTIMHLQLMAKKGTPLMMSDTSDPYVTIVTELIERHYVDIDLTGHVAKSKSKNKIKGEVIEGKKDKLEWKTISLEQLITILITNATGETITTVPNNRISNKEEHSSLGPAIGNVASKAETVDTSNAQEVLDDIPETGTLVQFAGVVLIAPFLPAIFGNMGLTKQGAFVSPKKQERAAHLLHYITTGTTKPAHEDELAISKLLCGLHIDSFLDLRKLSISKVEKQEIDELFVAVKKYWPVLKNTSVQNIQVSFLQREGILYPRDTNYLLKIDRTTIDILLDQMQWGFRMVKLPWCEYMVETDW